MGHMFGIPFSTEHTVGLSEVNVIYADTYIQPVLKG